MASQSLFFTMNAFRLATGKKGPHSTESLITMGSRMFLTQMAILPLSGSQFHASPRVAAAKKGPDSTTLHPKRLKEILEITVRLELAYIDLQTSKASPPTYTEWTRTAYEVIYHPNDFSPFNKTIDRATRYLPPLLGARGMGYLGPYNARYSPPGRAYFSNLADQPNLAGLRQSSRGGTEMGRALEVDISSSKDPGGHTAYYLRFSMSVQVLALFCGVVLGFLSGNREQLANLDARKAEVEDEATKEGKHATSESAVVYPSVSTSTLAASAIGPRG